MTIQRLFVNASPVLGIVLGLAGCSTSVPTGKLSGTVSLDGKPVRIGTVVAVSEDGALQRQTEIGGEGEYVLDQIPAGKYKFAVVPPRDVVKPPGSGPNPQTKIPKDMSMPTPPKDVVLPKEAGSFGKDAPLPGGIRMPKGVKVPEEMIKKMEERARSARGIPNRYVNQDQSGLTFEVQAAPAENQYDLKLSTKAK